ncbi:MAG: winged helix-turn-helix transcriptional regulator [bacterium]|nr:winged helix-turn-helix transcriptional regulator [bacterium]
MTLPINVDYLITGQSIEWERLEFKEGWNPVNTLHSICAFANDINNWGGGYIVIGIKEENGKPLLPPKGLEPAEIDSIQKKLIELCHRITPHYFPLAVPVTYKGKHLLVLWVPGGDTRPYKAPETLGKKTQTAYYVRRYSATVKAGHQEELRLMQLTAKVPFDDRINHHAFLEDLNLTLIKAFLKEINSELFRSAGSIPFEQLCRQMQVVRGPEEYLKPVNCGLLFFNPDPHHFFKGARIEVVHYHDDIGDKFTEKIFTGPLHDQLRSALRYIRDISVRERVLKVEGKAEAKRYFNYPYEAVEEALANAVYHRSYEALNPIEVNVRHDRIEIISFPGPMPPVHTEALKKEKVIVRDYRNRRIGDFLKELDLTEGRSTGFPKIRRQLKQNGSPEPVFQTDDQLSHFLTILYAHPDFTSQDKDFEENGTVNGTANGTVNETQRKILEEIEKESSISYNQMAERLKKGRTTIYRNIKKMVDLNIIKRSGSDKDGYWEVNRDILSAIGYREKK